MMHAVLISELVFNSVVVVVIAAAAAAAVIIIHSFIHSFCMLLVWVLY
jgi:hypothetical protein